MASDSRPNAKARQERFEHQLHGRNVAQPADSFEMQKAQYLDRLAQTGMSDAGTKMLDNMVDRTFMLGNLSEAEVNEIKWRLHVQYIKIKARFPHQESVVQGKYRAYCFDDRSQDITALTDEQKIIISQMLIGIAVYVSRSRGGFQQEQLVKSISVSEVRNPDEEEEKDGIIRGLLG